VKVSFANRLDDSLWRIVRRKWRERAAERSATDHSNSRLSVIEAELQSGQSPMELTEFPLRDPEASGFEWSKPAIGRADGDDDVTALIVPRMPHHVAPRRSPSPSLSLFIPLSDSLFTLLPVALLAWVRTISGYAGEKILLLIYFFFAIFPRW